MNDMSGYGECFADLANAVIQLGASDWRNVKRRLLKHELELKMVSNNTTKYDSMSIVIKQDKLELTVIEKFFKNSEWFAFLPNLAGKDLLDLLYKDWEEEKENEIKRAKALIKEEKKRKDKKKKGKKESA